MKLVIFFIDLWHELKRDRARQRLIDRLGIEEYVRRQHDESDTSYLNTP